MFYMCVVQERTGSRQSAVDVPTANTHSCAFSMQYYRRHIRTQRAVFNIDSFRLYSKQLDRLNVHGNEQSFVVLYYTINS